MQNSKGKIKKLLTFFTVLLLIAGWLFSGWPQIWQNPQIPSKIKEVKADVATNSPTTTTGSWVNPNNAYTDGSGYANITSGSPSATQTYSNYGLSFTGNVTQVRVRMDALSIGGVSSNQTRRPTGDDADTATCSVTPTTPTTRYDKVNEISYNDSNYYTMTQNGGGPFHTTFNFTNFSVPAGSTIINLTVYYRAGNTATNAANIRASVKVNGIYYGSTDSGYDPVDSPNFNTYSYSFAVNPGTGSAWTADEINGVASATELQAFGTASTDLNPDVKVSWVYATVNYTNANNEIIEMDVSWDGGTNWSSSKHQRALTGTETTYWIDVTSDTSWTPAKLNNSNFRVRVDGLTVGDPGDVRLDWIPVEVTYTVSTTTLGNGASEPGNITIGPGESSTDLDNFTLQTNIGIDIIAAAEVTLAPTNAYQNIAQVDITDTSNLIKCTATGLTSNTVIISACNISVTASLTAYKVRITPKIHSSMPSPPGASYDIGGTITDFTCANQKVVTDTTSATVTIDNASSNDANWTTITPGDGQIELSWANPGADFNKVLILRKAGSAISDIPTEGQEYSVPGTIGGSAIIYVNNGTTFIDTGLINGTSYFYKIFAYDNYMNYAVGVDAGPYVSQAAAPATWLADPDTPIGGFSRETVIRLRVQITNSGSEALNYNYGLEYAQKNGGTCGDDESFVVIPVIPTTEHFIMTASSYVADGDSTASKLPLPGHTFDSGKIIADPSESSGNFNLGFERYTEFEFVIKSTASASGYYCFRTINAGIALDEYAVYPELEIIP